jgi:hypothetical protein
VKITGKDSVTKKMVELSVSLTTDHPDSCDEQPVMYVEDWGSCMSVDDWMRGFFVVSEETEAEAELFRRWFCLVEAIYS